MRPLLGVGLISAACVVSRPRETALLAALDAHHEASAGLVAEGLREAEPVLHDAFPLASLALHSEIAWLGALGRWLPLLPTSSRAVAHWWPAVSAAQLIVYATAAGYLLRKLLPSRATRAHLSASVGSLRRPWSLVAAAAAPTGLVHWLHCASMVLLVAPELEGALGGRTPTLRAYLIAGAAASLATVVAQLPFGRRANARASVSGAVAGLVALRAALLRDVPIQLGAFQFPAGRALLVHLALELVSNPSPRARGLERLVALLGGVAVLPLSEPQLLSLARAGSWRELAAYARESL